MALFLKKIHRILYFAAVLLFFVPCYPVLLFFATNPEKYYRQIVFIRKWISIFSVYLIGIRFKIKYETEVDWSRPYVICPNHTSMLDITALTYLCPQPFSFIGKIELLKNPVTRIFFKTIDIPVDRSSKVSAFKAFSRGCELLQNGRSVVIFPEGKIDDEYPPRLHRFRSGAFKMATANNIDLLPVVIHDAWKLFWDDGSKYGSKPGTIHITVLSPIKTSQGESTEYKTFEMEVYEKMNVIWRQYQENLDTHKKN